MTQVIETQGSPPADFPVDDDTGEFIVYAAPDMTAGGLQRVDTRRLLQGMFVAGLDRPWSDTPLPHGGLLVDSDAVLQSVRHYCRFVMVDADRSSSGLAAAIQAAAVLSADPMPDDGAWAPHAAQSAADVAAATAQHDTPRRAARAVNVPRPRDDVRPAEVTRAKILRLVRESDQAVPPPHGALSGVRRWLGLGRGKAADDSPDTRMLQREQALLRLRDRWGDAVGACDHGEGAPIRESIALARPVHARLVAATDIAVRQVRHGTPLALEPLVEVADALAASIANAPHAMRWLAAFHADNAATPNPATYAAVHLADFGRALGMELAALRELALIALLADVGKALLPRPVLEHPGVLEPSDFALMKQHVTIGLDILKRCCAASPSTTNGSTGRATLPGCAPARSGCTDGWPRSSTAIARSPPHVPMPTRCPPRMPSRRCTNGQGRCSAAIWSSNSSVPLARFRWARWSSCRPARWQPSSASVRGTGCNRRWSC